MRTTSNAGTYRAVLALAAGLCACNGGPEPELRQDDPAIKVIAPGYGVAYHIRWNNEGWALDTPDCINYSGTCDEQTFTLRVDCGAMPCEAFNRADGTALGRSTVVEGEIWITVKPTATGTLAPRFVLTHSETGEQVVLEAQPIRVLAPTAIAGGCRYSGNSSLSESRPCGQVIPLLETSLPATTGTRVTVYFRVTASDGTVLLTGATPTADGQPIGAGSSWQCASNYGAHIEEEGSKEISLACGVLTDDPMRSTISLAIDSLVASVSANVQK